MAKKGKHGLDTGNVIVKWRSKKVRRREAKEKIASLFLDRSTCLSKWPVFRDRRDYRDVLMDGRERDSDMRDGVGVDESSFPFRSMDILPR